jgi:hypothetical protein
MEDLSFVAMTMGVGVWEMPSQQGGRDAGLWYASAVYLLGNRFVGSSSAYLISSKLVLKRCNGCLFTGAGTNVIVAVLLTIRLAPDKA